MSIWTWVAGIAFMVAVTYLTLPKMTYTWLADRDSPYAFAPVEMERFSVREKLDRIRPIAANA